MSEKPRQIIESQSKLYELTPALKKVDFRGVEATKVVLIGMEKGKPRTFTEALKQLEVKDTDGKTKSLTELEIKAIRARAAQKIDVGVSPGDSLRISNEGGIPYLEFTKVASGMGGRAVNYVVPLADVTPALKGNIERLMPYYEVVDRKSILLQSHRAWEGLRDAANKGKLFEVMRALRNKPFKNKEEFDNERKKFWGELVADRADFLEYLKSKKEAKSHGEKAMTKAIDAPYRGSAEQNWLLGQYLLWEKEIITARTGKLRTRVEEAEKKQGNAEKNIEEYLKTFISYVQSLNAHHVEGDVSGTFLKNGRQTRVESKKGTLLFKMWVFPPPTGRNQKSEYVYFQINPFDNSAAKKAKIYVDKIKEFSRKGLDNDIIKDYPDILGFMM